jgi:hypothetical protein
MAFDADLTSPALIERFEPYFKHPDPDRYVLRMGDRAVACKNAKTALAKLGFARVFGNDPELYDSELAEAVGRKRSAPARSATTRTFARPYDVLCAGPVLVALLHSVTLTKQGRTTRTSTQRP